MEKPIRFGILGPGGIVRRLMKDFHKANGAVVTAVASRSLERAQKAAALYGAKHAFGSYEELARCEDVDVVYVATPHNFHAQQAILCMNHKKHVLCEKPMALNDDEVSAMVKCARDNNVFLMEAMWTRFFPATKKVVELIGQGAIGQPLHMEAKFSSKGTFDPESRIYSKSLAGGALLDLGVYVLMYASMVFGYAPEKVQSSAILGQTGVDEHTLIHLVYPGGKTAQLMCGVRVSTPHTACVYGTEGMIEIPDFWHATRFTLTKGGQSETFSFDAEDEGFYHEIEHTCQCIRQGLIMSPVVSHDESISISRISTQMRKEWGLVYPEEA